MDEICEWPLATPARQRGIVAAARERLAAMKQAEPQSNL